MRLFTQLFLFPLLAAARRASHHIAGTALAMLLLAGAATAQSKDMYKVAAEDFFTFDPAKAKIGQLLFYDKVLSGNENISCGTCHHHDLAGGDGLSLGVGEGGEGIGPDRTTGIGRDRIGKRVPRSAPTLWNLGHKDITLLFHDGRLAIDNRYGNGFDSPAKAFLPKGLDHILSAQSLFPMTAQFEMSGHPSENDIAAALEDSIDKAWPIITDRVRAMPEYTDMFIAAFDDVSSAEDLTIVHLGNALGAFMGLEWQSVDSPWDAYLNHGIPLPAAAERGRDLFFGKGQCSSCHSGPLFTDQGFHALALPAFGPGKPKSTDPVPRDLGRMEKTNQIGDAYRFRTPSLRNVTLTAPYGHNGAYPTLWGILDHHRNPYAAMEAWSPNMAKLPEAGWLTPVDFVIQRDAREMDRQMMALDLPNLPLSDYELADIEAFLHMLTGETADVRPLGRPDQVPSGLPVD